MKKVGIMGGTFNPIHNGHLFLAENAYEQVGMDEILFMPSKNPPHKLNLDLVSDQHRTNMVKLAIEDNPHFKISTMELEREGITYTADTLSILTRDNPDTEFYFIEGADSLMTMKYWMKPQTVFDLCTIVVAGRDDVDFVKLNNEAKYYQKKYQAKVLILKMPTIQIASANIRDRIAEAKSIRYHVPEVVLQYIKKHKLYDRTTED